MLAHGVASTAWGIFPWLPRTSCLGRGVRAQHREISPGQLAQQGGASRSRLCRWAWWSQQAGEFPHSVCNRCKAHRRACEHNRRQSIANLQIMAVQGVASTASGGFSWSARMSCLCMELRAPIRGGPLASSLVLPVSLDTVGVTRGKLPH